jgi:predicted PurR-regulated permease PerM
MAEKTQPYTFDRVVRLIIGISVLIIIFLLIRRLSSVLLPFFIALLLAYMLDPLVLFFQFRFKLKYRFLAVAATLLLLATIIVGSLFLIVPRIANEISNIAQIISNYTQGVNLDSFLPVVWQNEIREFLANLDSQSIMANEGLMSALRKIAPQLWSVLNGSLSFLLGITVLIIIFLYLVFILLDYEKIADGIKNIIPPKYRALGSEIFDDIQSGMNRYFRGQALIALIVGIMFSIGFSIIGLPMAIVFGLFVGLLNLVPYLQTIAVVPALLLVVLQSAQTGQSFLSAFLGLFIVFIIVQGTQDLILVPRIMGKVTGLHPAVILLSLSIWGSLMGMIGLIVALPLTTLIISYYKRFVLRESEENSELTETIKTENPDLDTDL